MPVAPTVFPIQVFLYTHFYNLRGIRADFIKKLPRFSLFLKLLQKLYESEDDPIFWTGEPAYAFVAKGNAFNLEIISYLEKEDPVYDTEVRDWFSIFEESGRLTIIPYAQSMLVYNSVTYTSCYFSYKSWAKNIFKKRLLPYIAKKVWKRRFTRQVLYELTAMPFAIDYQRAAKRFKRCQSKCY